MESAASLRFDDALPPVIHSHVHGNGIETYQSENALSVSQRVTARLTRRA